MSAGTAAQDNDEPRPLDDRPASPRRRLVYLDNLRAFLITAVVVGHVSATYGVEGDWYYYEGGEVNPILYTVMMMAAAIGLGFALGLFFLIAGYFTAPAYDRKGPAGFMVDRLRRLGIPLLVFEFLINPFVHYAVDSHGGEGSGCFYDCQYQGTLWQYLKEYPRNIGDFADGPVWFMAVLLLFSAVYAVWRTVRQRSPAGATGTRVWPPALPGNGALALFALALGLVTFAVRLRAKVFTYYPPLHIEPAHLPQYVALFIAGLCSYRGDWLAQFSDRQARIWRWVALACVLALPALLVSYGALSGSIDERVAGGFNWLSLSYSVWEGLLCVSMVITLLTWFRARWDHQGRLARAMADASFGVYVVHPGIIVPLALALSPIRMDLSLKFFLVAPMAVTLCYLVVHILRKAPLGQAILG